MNGFQMSTEGLALGQQRSTVTETKLTVPSLRNFSEGGTTWHKLIGRFSHSLTNEGSGPLPWGLAPSLTRLGSKATACPALGSIVWNLTVTQKSWRQAITPPLSLPTQALLLNKDKLSQELSSDSGAPTLLVQPE